MLCQGYVPSGMRFHIFDADIGEDSNLDLKQGDAVSLSEGSYIKELSTHIHTHTHKTNTVKDAWRAIVCPLEQTHHHPTGIIFPVTARYHNKMKNTQA